MASAVSIGGISVSVTANVDKFRKGMDKARAELSKFQKSAAAFTKSIPGIGAALGGLALGAFARQQAVVIDGLAKMSSQLGMAVADLQGLQHAANLSGVRVETLNQSLKGMVRRLSEAAQGQGEAVNVLAELGLSAEKLAALAPERQLLVIADAMTQVESHSDKVRIASKLFGEEGTAMLQMLKGGAFELSNMSNELKLLGVALTDEAAAKVEAANDAWTRFVTMLSAAGAKMIVALSPAFTWIVDKLTSMIEYAMKFAGMMARAKKWTGDAARYFVDGTPMPGSEQAKVTNKGLGKAAGNIGAAAGGKAMRFAGNAASSAKNLLGKFGATTGLNDMAGVQQSMRLNLMKFAMTGGVDSSKVTPLERKTGERGTGVRNLLGTLGDTVKMRAQRFAMETAFKANMLGKGATLLGKATMLGAQNQPKAFALNNASIGAVDANSAAGFAQRVRAMRNDPQLRLQKDQLAELKKIAKNTGAGDAAAAAFA